MEPVEASQVFDRQLDRVYDGSLPFEDLALELFQYQKEHNRVYRQFLEYTGQWRKPVRTLEDIPFLPVGFFKTKTIQTGFWPPDAVFSSSGTTGMVRSRHFIPFLAAYEKTARRIFESQLIGLDKVQILGLLPTYLDNPESSLIHMVRSFGEANGRPALFFRLDLEGLEHAIGLSRMAGLTPVVFAVTYSLLKLAETPARVDMDGCLLIETGGMKGLHREMCKPEILALLRERFPVQDLYSEYGMTEMQSQAYGTNGRYRCGFSMRVLRREVEDPLASSFLGGRGVLNVIDLANYGTCCFIATDDLGEVHSDLEFEVFGRLDQSDVRGCNLLFS